ncbi:ABC transporter permease subunit [Proteinivorax tanatarense]|uniref:ABC transporter permease subunit n=1 Tax=Proteinivorax tanatarense TaxID=1260629 RepID=A0AAU7VJN9_9FIRM
MVGLLKFEVKKLLKGKKFLWLLVVVVVATAGVYYQNISQYSNVRRDTLDEIGAYRRSIGIHQNEFIHERKKKGSLDDIQQKQYQHTQDMLRSVQRWYNTVANRWSRAFYFGDWEELLIFEKEFYDDLAKYEEELGGEPLLHFQGVEKEIAIAKNNWLMEYNFFHEDETYPDSPHLNLVQSSSFLFGIIGISILIALFGGRISEEKSKHTWLTLRTQPVKISKLVLAKYVSLSVALTLFITMVVIVGLLVPAIFSDYSINLNYPHVLKTGESFTLVSTSVLIARAAFQFLFVAAFAFSISLVFDKTAQNSFTSLIMTIVVMSLCYVLTGWLEIFQTAINPFYHFYYPNLKELPNIMDLIYPMVLVLWSGVFILLAILIPEKQINLLYGQNFKSPFKKGITRDKSSEIITVNIFQWRKIRRKGILLKTFAILFILTLFIYSVLSQRATEAEKEYIGNLEERIEINKQQTIPESKEMMETELENVHEDFYQTTKESWEIQLEYLYKSLEKKEAAVKGYYKGDWTAFYENELFNLQVSNGDIPTGRGGRSLRRTARQFSVDSGLEEVMLKKENDIQPIFIPQYHLPNIFEDDEARSRNIRSRIGQNGVFTFYHYFERYIYLIPLIIFIIIFGGGLTQERGNKPTINFLMTQPIKYSKLFFGKMLNGQIMIIMCCLIFFMTAVLVSTTLNGFGDWDYPILRYDSEPVVDSPDYAGTRTYVRGWNRGFHFISIARFLAECTVLFMLITIFLTTISYILSLYIKNRIGVLTLTAVIGAGGYAFSQFLGKTAHLSPFVYLNIPKTISGEFATLMNNPKIHLLTGSILLITLSTMIMIIGYLFFIKSNKGYKPSEEKTIEG